MTGGVHKGILGSIPFFSGPGTVRIPPCSSRYRVLNAVLPLLFLLATILFPSSADAGRRKSSKEPGIVQQARTIAIDDRREAMAILEDYLAANPDPDLVPWVAINAGEQRRLAMDPLVARSHFERVRDQYPDHLLQSAAVLGITLVDCGETPSGNQLATLSLISPRNIPDTMNADRYRLLALHASRAGEPFQQVVALASQAVSFAVSSHDPVVVTRVRQEVGPLLVQDPQTRQSMTEQLSGLGATDTDGSELARAQQALLSDDFQQAIRIAEAYLASFPESDGADEARYIIERANHGDPVNVHTIGVLLPLSGTYAPPGKRLKGVIELAASQEPGSLRFLFRDTAGDPDQALRLAEDLVMQDGAVALLGPLLKETSTVVSQAAQAMRVPIITFTQKQGITEIGDEVYQAFLTPAQQIHALLDFVVDYRGMRSFAIMAPDNAYGQQAAALFRADVEERSASVKRTVFYDPGKGDFREAAQELAQKDYESRSSEFWRLKRQAEAKGMDPDKVVLPPLVNFEAIFIPDGYHRVALVASGLAYEEFSIGAFKPRRSDVPLLLLGLNGWHDDRLALEGGDYVRNCLLVDAFAPDLPDSQVTSFVSLFSQSFSQKPGVLDAVAYDTTRMLFTAYRTGVTDRPSMKNAIANVDLPDPVARGGQFNQNRMVERNLIIFQVTESGIEPWQDPALGEPE